MSLKHQFYTHLPFSSGTYFQVSMYTIVLFNSPGLHSVLTSRWMLILSYSRPTLEGGQLNLQLKRISG